MKPIAALLLLAMSGCAKPVTGPYMTAREAVMAYSYASVHKPSCEGIFSDSSEMSWPGHDLKGQQIIDELDRYIPDSGGGSRDVCIIFDENGIHPGPLVHVRRDMLFAGKAKP